MKQNLIMYNRIASADYVEKNFNGYSHIKQIQQTHKKGLKV